VESKVTSVEAILLIKYPFTHTSVDNSTVFGIYSFGNIHDPTSIRTEQKEDRKIVLFGVH
jgi:hypothetical protein